MQQHLAHLGPDQLILVLLDGGDDVAHLGIAPAGQNLAQVSVRVHQPHCPGRRLRLREKRRRRLEDLIRPAQLGVLPLELLDPSLDRRRHPRPLAGIDLGRSIQPRNVSGLMSNNSPTRRRACSTDSSGSPAGGPDTSSPPDHGSPGRTSWVQPRLSLLVRSEPPVDPGRFRIPHRPATRNDPGTADQHETNATHQPPEAS